MATIAILYGTTEGQTAKIAQHMAARLRGKGHRVDIVHLADVADDFSLDGYAAAVLGASIHEGHHQRYVMRWVKEHRKELAARVTAWFSVCLGINSPHLEERQQALAFPEEMAKETGLNPTMSITFAGALKYTEYSWLKRIAMRHISGREGGDTDTSRDYEYTDWVAVDAFTDQLDNKLSG